MLSKFIMIVSIITNEGELQMRAFDVEVCPEVQSFGQEMNKMKQQGEFIGWNAICLDRQVPTEEL